MKRLTAAILAIALLLAFSGCAKEESETVQKTPAQLLMEAAGDLVDEEIIQVDVQPEIEWQIINENDGTWGWVPGDAVEVSALELTPSTAYSASRTRQGDTVLFQMVDLEDNVVLEYAVPMVQDQEGSGAYAMDEDALWLVHQEYEWIENDGDSEQTVAAETLECWTRDGEKTVSIPLEQLLGDPEMTVYDMAICGDQILMAVTEGLYFLDKTGAVLNILPLTTQYNTFYCDRDGNIYFRDGDSDAIYTIDLENHGLGVLLFDTDYLEKIYPGSGPYDFFLCGDTIRAVDLTNQTITELLALEDYGLTDMVRNVLYGQEGQLVLGLFSAFTHDVQYQAMNRVAPEDIPEKKVLTLAYGMGDMLSDGFTWKQTSKLQEKIADFELKSQYTIEVVEFSDVSSLNISMAAGEIPDIICWTNDLRDDAAISSYQRNGYLANLLDYMEADPLVDPDDLLENVRKAYTAQDGAIYRLPTSLSCDAIIGNSQLVGGKQGWSTQELYEAAQNMPEDTTLIDMTSSIFLKYVLQYTLSNYVDADAGTCTFDNDDFRALMYTARDYLPTEEKYVSLNGTAGALEGLAAGEVMLKYTAFIGGVEFASEQYAEYEAAGVIMVGYPGLGGNGIAACPSDSFSICAIGSDPDGAWEFLRNFFTYDAQKENSFFEFPIMESALTDGQEELQRYYEYTDEQLELGIEMVKNAVVLDLEDNVILNIVMEDAEYFLSGEKSFEEVASIIENRVRTYLSERS